MIALDVLVIQVLLPAFPELTITTETDASRALMLPAALVTSPFPVPLNGPPLEASQDTVTVTVLTDDDADTALRYAWSIAEFLCPRGRDPMHRSEGGGMVRCRPIQLPALLPGSALAVEDVYQVTAQYRVTARPTKE